MTALLLQGNALSLPIADSMVDLIVTSPPYFGLRSYQDGGEHYAGQIGAEATPVEFVNALIAATREMVRVLKPSGSIWVNLGDKYAGGGGGNYGTDTKRNSKGGGANPTNVYNKREWLEAAGMKPKSLIGIPWRYAIRCIDELGLILRAEVIWSKPNGLPESVTDRVRRSHETWFHFTKSPRYFAAVDEVREPHAFPDKTRTMGHSANGGTHSGVLHKDQQESANPLGKLPGSVRSVATQPLRIPPEVGVQHFAAFPMEWPRWIVAGWSPSAICTVCGEGRRPVVDKELEHISTTTHAKTAAGKARDAMVKTGSIGNVSRTIATITGYACACPDISAPTRSSVILDPFGGTGTTALMADVMGRDAISVDMSADYCRAAHWRTTDPKERAKAEKKARGPAPVAAPEVAEVTFIHPDQLDLFGDDAA